jgi:pimeloyl-[acyl-carrier protein] methyl ester esterase
MRLPTLILLPGLHGTADLFAPFLNVIPAEFPRRVISYPSDKTLSYDQLLDRIGEELKEESTLVLIAESFSGPLAVRFAADHPERVKAIVLVASFVRLPRPPWQRRLLAPLLFRLPISIIALRRYLAGPQAPRDVVVDLRNSLRHSRPAVLLARLRESFRVDCSDALSRCPMPLLYLAGTEDHLMPRQALDTILAIRPDTLVVTIPGSHMLLQTKPAECWREIAPFVQRYS